MIKFEDSGCRGMWWRGASLGERGKVVMRGGFLVEVLSKGTTTARESSFPSSSLLALGTSEKLGRIGRI
jgi:hypothetical protein